MKRFKTISTTFIVVIAVIFSCNVYYLVSLYNSIRSNVERDVMTALADADIDDLMFRAGRAQALASNVQMHKKLKRNRLQEKRRQQHIEMKTVNSYQSGLKLTELLLKSARCYLKTRPIPIRWLML